MIHLIPFSIWSHKLNKLQSSSNNRIGKNSKVEFSLIIPTPSPQHHAVPAQWEIFPQSCKKIHNQSSCPFFKANHSKTYCTQSFWWFFSLYFFHIVLRVAMWLIIFYWFWIVCPSGLEIKIKSYLWFYQDNFEVTMYSFNFWIK